VRSQGSDNNNGHIQPKLLKKSKALYTILKVELLLRRSGHSALRSPFFSPS